MRRVLALVAVGLLIAGCPPPPAPQVVQITSPGHMEAEAEWQVHVVRVERVNEDKKESTGAPVQAALVAWIGSWQNLELVDFQVIDDTQTGSRDLVIAARRRR